MLAEFAFAFIELRHGARFRGIEQFDRAANEAMTKSLKLGEQEQHMATEMINAFQDQAKKMWDNNVKFMEMAMSSNKTMADQMTSMMENAAKRN
mgnify:CR=1 FL=1